MSVEILDGKLFANEIQNEVKAEVEKMRKEGKIPGLGVVLVGNDPASQVYVKNKSEACANVGIFAETIRLPQDTTEEKLLEKIDELNKDNRFHGILVQLPLPKQIDEKRILERISPLKDVDGFHPLNVGRLTQGIPYLVPCTPAGIMEIFRRKNIELKGKEAVVIGRSDIVGKPMALLLLHSHATVTICHSRTLDLPSVSRRADILVVAIGKPEFVTAEYVKKGAVVIDVGINRVKLKEPIIGKDGKLKDSKLVGDVKFDEVKEIAGAITPVPGGVGPLTIAMLLLNTIKAAKTQITY